MEQMNTGMELEEGSVEHGISKAERKLLWLQNL